MSYSRRFFAMAKRGIVVEGRPANSVFDRFSGNIWLVGVRYTRKGEAGSSQKRLYLLGRL
jgi:hypothetical protein